MNLDFDRRTGSALDPEAAKAGLASKSDMEVKK
jgi:hypothetical protein